MIFISDLCLSSSLSNGCFSANDSVTLMLAINTNEVYHLNYFQLLCKIIMWCPIHDVGWYFIQPRGTYDTSQVYSRWHATNAHRYWMRHVIQMYVLQDQDLWFVANYLACSCWTSCLGKENRLSMNHSNNVCKTKLFCCRREWGRRQESFILCS